MSNLKIHINGAQGRMGQALLASARNLGVQVTGTTDLGDDFNPGLEACEVLIDFSFHEATVPLMEAAVAHKKPMVIGTTGHGTKDKARIRELTKQIPTVWAGNYSVGVNLLFYLTEKAAGILDESYHPEVVEMHHAHKKDAPSGTAENLVEAILRGRDWAPDTVRQGRSGITGERPTREIGVHALRGGEVVGDHTVLFAGTGERLELTHKAADRTIFADGAIRAAGWVRHQPPGFYDMQDVLGLRQP